MESKVSPEKTVREIRRKTRKKYSAEEKIRIVLEGLRGEGSISAICRREGISPNLYYRWRKDFLESSMNWASFSAPSSGRALYTETRTPPTDR